MQLCMYHVCVYGCMTSINTYIHVRTSTYLHTYVRTKGKSMMVTSYMCMHAPKYLCITSVHVHKYVCAYIYKYMYVCTSIFVHVCTCVNGLVYMFMSGSLSASRTSCSLAVWVTKCGGNVSPGRCISYS